MHLSSGQWHRESLSCSIPKLWPISCATVVATRPTVGLWSIATPPENSYVHIGPLRALPTTPPWNWTPLREKRDQWFCSGRKKSCATLTSTIAHCRWDALSTTGRVGNAESWSTSRLLWRKFEFRPFPTRQRCRPRPRRCWEARTAAKQSIHDENALFFLLPKGNLNYRVDDVGDIFASPKHPLEVLFLGFVAFIVDHKH